MFYSENFSYSMDSRSFDKILEEITRETDSVQRKLDILFFSYGKFNAEQAEKILFMIPSNSAKLEALRIMEPRLTSMTCQYARRILRTFVVYDRVEALHLIKRFVLQSTEVQKMYYGMAVSVRNDIALTLPCFTRSYYGEDRVDIFGEGILLLVLLPLYLCDCQSRLGEECILSMFPFDEQKHAALSLLSTVRANLKDKMAAGSFRKTDISAGLPSLPLDTQIYEPIKLKHPHVSDGIPAAGFRREDRSAGLSSRPPPLDSHTYGSIGMKTTSLSNHSRMAPPRHYLTSVYPSHPTYVFAQPDYYAEQQREIKDGHRCNMQCVNAYSSTGNGRF